MDILPIITPIIGAGDNLAAVLSAHADIQEEDIIVISSKVIATAEGAAIDLQTLDISPEAQQWNEKTSRGPVFMQAVINETARMHGRILGSAHGVLLTELKPDGLEHGSLLVPNAGLDESNIGDGYAIGWPVDPVMSVKRLQLGLNRNCAVVMSDSCVHLGRIGVTAFALVSCGINPFRSEIGKNDLFERPMTMTVEAVADQLATAANMVMGNRAQSTPAVIIRNHGIPFSDYCGWVDGIERSEDLYSGILQ